jgi:hypothetical protein
VLQTLSISFSVLQKAAMVRWFAHLGHTYGASLMFLVGLGYLIQGFRCFPWFTTVFYLKDVLLVDPGILQIILNTVNLPMVAKPIYGIISDSVYIRGAHRIPYIVIGGIGSSCCFKRGCSLLLCRV